GVHLFGPGAAGSRIQGNLVGTDAGGTQMVANISDGIFVRFVPNVLIGGTAAEGNVVSGNGDNGIEVFDPSSAGTVISGNLVGTDITGVAARANNGNGIALT